MAEELNGGGTVHHVWDRQPAKVHVKLERNTKGYTWEISTDGEDPDQVLDVLASVDAKLRAAYTEPAT